ncbi:SAM-dependent methyltransferase [Saccharothrix lopnurensis]|uniref:SAM-dependent methyltransferase n=1 Tax=Saccharothrix lopnurensis TaxID=1670621 RepID=A0ABW1PC86_9PSEU
MVEGFVVVRPYWVPQDVDTEVPSIARAYDFVLGGAHNFAVDRELGARIEATMPGLRSGAHANRAFLGRAVRHMVDAGVRQFLDIGSGIPAVSAVHEVAQAVAPDARVVYVDRDPIAVAHSELILADNDRTGVVHADMRDVDGIFGSPAARRLLRRDEPIGLLMLLMLHWVPDEWDPHGLMRRYRDHLPAGSHLAITHITGDRDERGVAETARVLTRSKSPDQLTERGHADVLRMFGDFELVPPGLVDCPEWRPSYPVEVGGRPAEHIMFYAGVGRKTR